VKVVAKVRLEARTDRVKVRTRNSTTKKRAMA
jgi:hypothetical protein